MLLDELNITIPEYRVEETSKMIGILGEKVVEEFRWPETQFMITGVFVAGSNAHGPNEFLHITYGKKLTACVAGILRDFPG